MESDHLHHLPQPPRHHTFIIWGATAVVILGVVIGWFFIIGKNLPLLSAREGVVTSKATIEKQLDQAGATLIESFNQRERLLLEEAKAEQKNEIVEHENPAVKIIEVMKQELVNEAVTSEEGVKVE